MFPWSKRRETNERPAAKSDADGIADLIATPLPAYGEILETSPLVVFHVSKLPLPKDDMKNVLRLAWRLSRNPELRQRQLQAEFDDFKVRMLAQGG